MHPDEAALLKAVCAAPDDDLPRLVYADWLDEHDRPHRAEFIRCQIELAKLKRDSKRRRRLAFRCRELLDTAKDQLHNLPETITPEPWYFRRGFVEALEIDDTDLETDAAAAFRTVPVRRLRVTHDLEIDHLKLVPTGNSLTAIDLIGGTIVDADLISLSRMKRFPHLTELGLMCCELDDEAARVLCDRPFFQNLTALRVGGNPFTDAGRQLLRDHFGDRVSFTCERDPDYLYTFDKDESRLSVGFGRDHTQLLLLAGGERERLAVFDHAGNLIRFEEREGTNDGSCDAESKWLAKYGGEQATIRVKRFKFPNGIGIEDFNWWAEELEDSTSMERARYHDMVGGWLDEGQFRWTWVNDDMWLDRSGEVTDS
jgi:uncharacterized protein (TIGR02996 family)